VYLNAYIPLSPSPVQKPIVSYDELPEHFDLYDVDLILKVGEGNGYDTRMADLSAVSVDGVPMQLVPLLAWSGLGATQDMAKVFEWMLREFLLANLGGANRVDALRILHSVKEQRASWPRAGKKTSLDKTECQKCRRVLFMRRASALTRTCCPRCSTCWSGCKGASSVFVCNWPDSRSFARLL